jgi:hypothetical protein
LLESKATGAASWISGPSQLHLALHLSRAADGSLTGALDSIDQGAKGIPLSKVTENGRSLVIEIKAVGATYQAEMERGWIGDHRHVHATRTGSSTDLSPRRARRNWSVRRIPRSRIPTMKRVSSTTIRSPATNWPAR